MIRVSIVAPYDQVNGHYSHKSRQNQRVSTKGGAPLAEKFDFSVCVFECAGTMSALRELPCDATISVTFSEGKVEATGTISVYDPRALQTVTKAARIIETHAGRLLNFSRSMSATISLTQAWEKT
ncbi:MAG: hypothetical protein RLZZ342_175 [Candidatus Parcubacteria bacterium]|jgi:hypothetical protein